MAAGAHGIAEWMGTSREILQALDAALVGRVVLWAEVAKEIARSTLAGSELGRAMELSLIDRMGKGETVSDIAASAGYSEREIYRRLRAMYAAMGVANRTEALVWLARREAARGFPVAPVKMANGDGRSSRA